MLYWNITAELFKTIIIIIIIIIIMLEAAK
jgi:hypothetical protein